MGTLHKRTHRPLALITLFALLGVVGWQLPRAGKAVLAYSNQALRSVSAARPATSEVAGQTVAAPQASSKALSKAAAAQLTPGQQAVAQARAELDAARAQAKTAQQSAKQGPSPYETALANYNAAVTFRLSEIKARLAQLAPSGNAGSDKDSGSAPALPAEYQTLLNEVASYGGFPVEGNHPLATEVAEVEPNNTSATATVLAGLNGTTQTVVIGTGGLPVSDQDFWRIDGAPAGSKIWAFIDTGASSASRDSIMELRAADGTTIIEDDDDGASATNGGNTVLSTSASAIANRTLTAGGTFFLRVAHFSGATAITSYKLYVTITTTSSAEVEGNNTSGAADSITPTATDRARVRTGSIGSGTDVDFYSVVVAANTTLYINADCDPERDGTDTDIIVDVVDTNGTTQILSVDGTPSFFSVPPESEATSNLRVAAGTYFIRVRPFSTADTGTYALMVGLASPTAVQVCPPTPITSNLGVAGGNFPKVTGTQTQRLFRDGVVSACGVPRTQAAPITGGPFTFDRYTLVNGPTTSCVTISLTVNETAASNYMVGAFSVHNPANLTSGWLGDSGLSSGIPPSVQTFSVNIAAGASFDVVVFNTNTTGNGNSYSLSVVGLSGCTAPPCTLTCPENITVGNSANQCGATVTYPAPTTGGFCQTVTCTPASGSFFPLGTTTVNCTGTSPGNPNATCSFTVTVNDTQPPAITCPPNQFVGTTGATAVVNYPLPTVTDNCPGVAAPVCNPAPGFAFPVGTTTVNCSVQDAVANTATCSFQVTVNRLSVPGLSDPLACTGPGNVLSGSFTVNNNGGGAQTVAATVTLGPSLPFQQLLALPGSCVVTPNIGTCTVVNGSTITYAATLNAGQSATVSYRLQVADGVLPSAVLTSSVSASFNGGPAVTAGASTTANCQAPGPGPFYPARSEVTDVKAGSVLVYPIYTSSVGSPTQDSRISLTNIHPNLAAYAHLFFVADTCAVSDAFLCLTPNQTSSFQASDLDPGTTGYLVVVASDGVTGCPINFNYLIGDEYVKFTSGHAANLGAEAISAIAGSAFWASCNNNAVSATLRFDGVSYNRLPYVVAVDNIGSRADGNDTMLILNRIGGDLRTGPSGLGNVFGVFYNDAEAQLSFTLNSSNCQYRFQVNNTVPRITPRFDQFITAGRSGWMKMYQRDGNAILGSVINFNPNAASNAGAFNQGHNLHHLTLTDTASYIIPIFPPSC